MNATKQNKSISAKKDTGECFTTKLKSTCQNSGTYQVTEMDLIGSLSTHVFETRTATGREHFAC